MVSSLENSCRVPGLIEILNYPHIKKEIFSLPINEHNYEERDDALQRVVSELLKDNDPVTKENIPRHLIIFIGFEMIKWAEYLRECFSLSFKFSEQFIKSSFFTSEGLLDEEKAARELVKEQSFSPFLKYNIACQYFLEDIIPGLWQELRNNEPNFKELFKEHNSECTMVMWSDYLEEINSSSEPKKSVKTPHFKEKVFSYGLKNKNLAAIKFSYGPKGKSTEIETEAKLVRELVNTTYCNFIRQTLKHIEFYEISSASLFSREFVADRNIIMYFLNLMNEEELKEFFLKFDDSFNIVSWFLLWPYQHQFMDFGHIIFENFGGKECRELICDIISLISDKYMRQFYDYRLLLREVWIKSSDHLKDRIVQYETRIGPLPNSIIAMLFTLPNFTDHDLDFVNLFLKYANSTYRREILINRGYMTCNLLIVSHSNFRMADLFLKTLDLSEETLQEFKTKFPFRNFHNIMMKQSISLFEEIFKWVVGSDEIDDFKDEIFRRLSEHRTDYFFIELEEETPFCFLNKILKFFLKTDENIKEWVRNIVYSPTRNYKYPKWFDGLLKYRGYSDEEASDIKREIIFGKLPEIAGIFNWGVVIESSLRSNILSLSLLKKEEILEFIDQLRSYYEDSVKNEICLRCLNPYFFADMIEMPVGCDHRTRGLITLEEIDRVCSSVSQIDFLLQKHEQTKKYFSKYFI